MCWPGMKDQVKELTDVAPDLLGLAADMLADDGEEPRAEGVVQDHPETYYAACSHHLCAVLNEI